MILHWGTFANHANAIAFVGGLILALLLVLCCTA